MTDLTARVRELEAALLAYQGAVSGPDGFAECVRRDAGRAYPWPALDEAERLTRAALEGRQP